MHRWMFMLLAGAHIVDLVPNTLQTELAVAQDVGQSLTVETVLANVRTALGAADFYPDHLGFNATGRFTHYGIESDFSLILDGKGRFHRNSTGLLSDLRTFDGTDAWVTDWTGATHHLLLQDRDLTLLSLGLCTNFWAVKPELFELAVVADKCTEKEAVLSIKRRDGRFQVNVSIDRATWLPTKAIGTLRDQVHTFTFEQFQGGPGFKLPWRWTHSARGTTTSAQYSHVGKVSDLAPKSFRLKTRGSTKAQFDGQKPSALVVKKAATGHLLVKPTIAGNDVGWFIFDSGAGYMTLEKKLIQKMEFTRIGEAPVGGAVGNSVKAALVKIPSLELGPVTIQEPLCIELDLQLLSLAMGEKIQGIVGYPLFQAAVVEVDCAVPAVKLHDPAHFQLPAKAAWQKLILDNYHPLVEAHYEGNHTGWFLLDTGMTDTVSFHSPTVRRLKLLDGRATTLALHSGITGMARAKAGKLEWFELGGHRFEHPRVTFAESDKGSFANEYVDGNLGQAFFLPFRLFFHFGAEQIAFVEKPLR